MSACRHSVFGNDPFGIRRATPTTDSTSGSAASERRTLVPTLPLAPTTTTRMVGGLPAYSHDKLAMHDHGHTHVHTDDTRRLTIALVLILGLMAAEVVAGILADSLALLSDAAHMLT